MDCRRGKFYAGLVHNLLEYAEWRFRNWGPEETDEANRPDLYYIWEWFLHIRAAPLGQRFQEMAAFAAVNGIHLRVLEGHAITALFGLMDTVASEPDKSPSSSRLRSLRGR